MWPIQRSTNERVLARHHSLARRSTLDSNDPTVPQPSEFAPAADPNSGTTPPAVIPNPAPVPPGVNPIAVTASDVPNSAVLPTTAVLGATLLSNSALAPPTKPLTVPSVIQTPATTPISQSTPLTSTTPHTTSSASTTASASGSNQSSVSSGITYSKKGGIPAGAIAGIVTAILIVSLLFIAFFVRKNYQRRRAVKRNTWGASLVPSLENKRSTLYGQSGASTNERVSNVSNSEMAQSSRSRGLNVPLSLVSTEGYGEHRVTSIAPPASVYNSATSPTPSPLVASSAQTPSIHSSGGGSISGGELAVVARTFIPSLPDELHISNAEQIRIINAYDDGWALCANSRGEQGVVPLECLDRRGAGPTEMQLQPHSGIDLESKRASRRMSSLSPVAPGTY